MKALRIKTKNGAVEQTKWFTRQSEATAFAKERAKGMPASESVRVEECRIRPASLLQALNREKIEIDPADVSAVMVFEGVGE